MFDITSFLDDHGIAWTDRDAGRGEWVNINCPFCREGDLKFKGGIHPSGYYNCWRCGPKSLEDLVIELLSVSFKRAKEIIGTYQRESFIFRRVADRIIPPRVDLPGGPLQAIHQDYLWDRDFDPFWAEEIYGVTGTSQWEKWHKLFYGDRLIIPIRDPAKRVISFQGRDVSGTSEIRYKGCPVDLSIEHYKQTLYGSELARKDMVVAVEGIFDQWRLGPGSVGTFGTSLSEAQVAQLAEWPVVLFAFDSEPEAQAKAKRYATQIAAFGRTVEVVDLEFTDGKDLADLSPREVADVRRALGLA